MCTASIMGLVPPFGWCWVANWEVPVAIFGIALENSSCTVHGLIMPQPLGFSGLRWTKIACLQLHRRRHSRLGTKLMDYFPLPKWEMFDTTKSAIWRQNAPEKLIRDSLQPSTTTTKQCYRLIIARTETMTFFLLERKVVSAIALLCWLSIIVRELT